MNKLFLTVGVLIFVVVAAFITFSATKTIFNKVAGDITGQVVENLTPEIAKSFIGGSSVKIEKKPCN